MKRIVQFHFYPECYAYDLADADLAICVSRPEGIISLMEGDGDDRFQGWALSPDANPTFTRESIGGHDCIVLTYLRCGEESRHMLGQGR